MSAKEVQNKKKLTEAQKKGAFRHPYKLLGI
jgi:hypothetical protein